MIGRDTKKDYANGFDFFDDLLKYGEADAIIMGNNYLDLPISKGDKEELKFRDQLLSAMKLYSSARIYQVIVNDTIFCVSDEEEQAKAIASFYKGRVEEKVVYSPFAKVCNSSERV